MERVVVINGDGCLEEGGEKGRTDWMCTGNIKDDLIDQGMSEDEAKY